MVFSITVANVLECEVPIEANKPPGECEEKLGERRVYVEVVRPQEVIRGKLSKMDLVETSPRLSMQDHKERG